MVRELKNCNIDLSQADCPKTLLRQKYQNKNELDPRLWYELVTLLSDGRPNVRATSSEFENAIEVFIS